MVESEAIWAGAMLLPEATAENVHKERDWLLPMFSDEAGKLRLVIQAFVIESLGRRILIDTCVGNDKACRPLPEWNNQQGPFLRDLANLGYPPEAIDQVVCTHLHMDHVGWNTTLQNGRWVPTFPKAQYVIGGTEWEFFSAQHEDFFKVAVDDSVRPVLAEGQALLVNDKHRLTDEVWLEAAPGHTPGQFAVRISSKGQEAVITGDLMHHPIQCRYPEWEDNYDVDRATARKTRREFCERYADTDVLVLGTHFASSCAGKIISKDGSFGFVLVGAGVGSSRTNQI